MLNLDQFIETQEFQRFSKTILDNFTKYSTNKESLEYIFALYFLIDIYLKNYRICTRREINNLELKLKKINEEYLIKLKINDFEGYIAKTSYKEIKNVVCLLDIVFKNRKVIGSVYKSLIRRIVQEKFEPFYT